MKHLFTVSVIAVALSACGGGRGDDTGTAPVAITRATSLSAYIGNWAASCDMHRIDSTTITRTPGAAESISVAYKTDYFANHDCTGAVVGTWTQSASVTAAYDGSVESSIVFTDGAAAKPARVDKVISSQPEGIWSVTGPGVVYTVGGGLGQWCINYADGDGSCISDSGTIQAAVVNPVGLYLQGRVMYELRWNGSSYSVNRAFHQR